QFGASAHDIDAITAWLQSQGLEVGSVANSPGRIGFSGSAANVGAAFASRLHFYVVNGEPRIAPAGVPQIPAALSAVVQSVHGLTTIKERPYHRVGTAQLIGSQIIAVDPELTTCSGGPCRHYILPADFA